MNDDLDPALQIAFANAERELPGETFGAAVMAGIERQRRLRSFGWLAIGAAGVVLVWLLALPLQNLALALVDGLGTSLVSGKDGLAMQMLAPLNSVAGVLALVLLAAQMLWRRIRG